MRLCTVNEMGRRQRTFDTAVFLLKVQWLTRKNFSNIRSIKLIRRNRIPNGVLTIIGGMDVQANSSRFDSY